MNWGAYVLRRFTALLAGGLAFVAVMSCAPLLLDLWSRGLYQDDGLAEQGPPPRFLVAVWRAGSAPGSAPEYAAVRWKDFGTVDMGRTFLLPHGGARIPSAGDSYRFDVLEDHGSWQLVEVVFRNTHSSWSRYRAYADRVEPVSYRTDGSFSALLPMLVLIVAAFVLALWVARGVGRSLGVLGLARGASRGPGA
jgi:hypothetical protein